MDQMGSVRLGVDRLLESGPNGLAGHGPAPRIGLLTHDGARVGRGETSSRWALLEAGFDLVRLFSPEHGITATAPDGHAVGDTTDRDTGLPVVSLYGPDLAPAPQHLAGLDLILVDLQDVGARFYTYVWTTSHLLETAAQAGIPVVILDRPNPIGGALNQAEGPILDADEASFLGRWPVPIRHSLTLGEMAGLLRAEMGLDIPLEVIPMAGWERTMVWRDTGLPFFPPSPGIPTREATLTYPALALLEATNLSVGRGTRRAFRWFGAPWLDGPALTEDLAAMEIPGLEVGEETLPGAAGSGPIPGVGLDVTDPSAFRPVALGLRLLALLASFAPGRFRWVLYPTAANPTGEEHFKRLLGHRAIADTLRTRPETVTEDDVTGWCDAEGWPGRVQDHLLYP